MSTDFIALFDLSGDPVRPEQLRDRFVKNSALFSGMIERYGTVFRATAWTIEGNDLSENGYELVGPGGFVLWVGSHSAELWHGIRFSKFSDAWHRQSLRQICHFIAGEIGSNRAIYTHELMPYDRNTGLIEIESDLRTTIGRPAESFDDLMSADYFGTFAWYIDTFADWES